MSCVYGPVPSRRLGVSLGIDIVPALTCTFDCIYCQLGKTLHKVINGDGIEFPNTSEILENLKAKLYKTEVPDYITISGSGEPTLNPELGDISDGIRTFTDIPLVLITNSSLLTYDTVLTKTKKFDIVMPSLDAGDNRTFKLINRPAPGFDINEITRAISRLKQESECKVWLEVMLLKGKITNAASESTENIAKKIDEILPDKVFLNTPIRPPSEAYVVPLDEEEMNTIKVKIEKEVSQKIDILTVPKHALSKYRIHEMNDAASDIQRLLLVRPCTLQDISDAMGMNLSEVGKYIEILVNEGKVSTKISGDETYYTSRR